MAVGVSGPFTRVLVLFCFGVLKPLVAFNGSYSGESDLKHNANLLPRYYLLTDYLLINVLTVKPRVTVWCDEAVLCFVLKRSGCVRFQLLHWRLLPGTFHVPGLVKALD